MCGLGPYLNIANAAEYCGCCDETFKKYAKLLGLRRCGFRKNMFAVSDLDRFMTDPEAMIAEGHTATQPYKPKKVEV